MSDQKTVFISYRHANAPIAQAVRLALIGQGYDVFVDFQSIPGGHFPKIITNQIKARAHFCLLLTPGALERCVEDGDWIRLEVETAMQARRNIVPLMFEGFDFGESNQFLAGDLMPKLPEYNGLPVYWAYFDEAMTRLHERYLNVDVESVLHPAFEDESEQLAEIQQLAEEKPMPSESELQAQQHYENGILSHRQSQYDDAIAHYTKAIEKDAQFVEAYLRRGHTYWMMDEYDKANADYQQALAIDPQHPERFVLQVYIHLGNSDAASAIEAGNQAVENYPAVLDSYIARAKAYTAHNDYAEAIADYHKVLEIRPDLAEAYTNIGNIYQKQHDYDKAIDYLSKSIELNPQSSVAYANRGNVYWHMQDWENAKVDFEKALDINPRNERAAALLEYVQSQMDD